jgi:hypothetical protein
MPVDWDEVKKIISPSPHYEDVIGRLQTGFSYAFVRELYNRSMPEASQNAARLLGSNPRQRYTAWIPDLQASFKTLEDAGVSDTMDLVRQVETRQKLEEFCKRTRVPARTAVSVLMFLLYWVLPAKIYLRELIEKDDPQWLAWVTALRENGVRFNLDVLDQGCTSAGRLEIARRTGVPEEVICELASRADFTRVPYTNGKTILHLCRGGYGSMARVKNTPLEKLMSDMQAYFNRIGMRMKSGMEFDAIWAIAATLPVILEE